MGWRNSGGNAIVEIVGFACFALAIVAVFGCTSSAPPAQTPGGLQTSPRATATPPATLPSAAPASRLVGLLEKMPLSLKESGIWFGDTERALDLADAPQPRSLEEIRALDEQEVEAYLTALRDVVQVSAFGTLREHPQEWIDTFGLDYFGIGRGIRTGGESRFPHALVYFEGDIDSATVRDKLLALGYESQEAAGLAYYAAPQGFHSLSNPAARLAMSSMDRVFVREGVLVEESSAIDMLVEVLKVRADIAPSLADDPSVLSIAQSLGEPVSAAILTRRTVLEPGFRPPLFYDKPADWGTLNEWDLFAAGYEIAEGSRWLTISLYYQDLTHADADAGEFARRIISYETVVPLLPGASPQLAAGWPEKPYAEMCGPLASSTSEAGAGSILTVRCPIKNGISWRELVGLRDLGFLLP